MIIIANSGLKLSYRNNLDQPEFECLDDCVKVMTESQIEEFGCITDTCEKRRRRSYGYTSDTNTDTGPTARTAINFGRVSRCMASKFNDGKTGHQLSANYTMDEDCDAGSGGERGDGGERGGEGVTATYPVNGCGIKREVPSSSSNNNNSSNSSSNNNTSNNSNNNSSSNSSSSSSSNLHFDHYSVSGIHHSQQHGSQHSVRLQNIPSEPLFPRSKTDATNNNTNTLGKNLAPPDQSNSNMGTSVANNIHINGNNENGNSANNGNNNTGNGNNNSYNNSGIGNNNNSSMLSITPAPKKIFCPIQSRIVDLINLCKNNILGAGTGTGTGSGLNGGLNLGTNGVGLLSGTGNGNGMGSNSHNNSHSNSHNINSSQNNNSNHNSSNHRMTAQHTHTQAHSSSNNSNNNYNSNSSYHSNSSNGGELLQISDVEMLNFPKLFTDAFNIGDYEGVSTVSFSSLLFYFCYLFLSVSLRNLFPVLFLSSF